MSTTMRAAVCVEAGGPEVLEIRELPIPQVRDGWSLVRVEGAGLNRSELRTRQGHSPNVAFPGCSASSAWEPWPSPPTPGCRPGAPSRR